MKYNKGILMELEYWKKTVNENYWNKRYNLILKTLNIDVAELENKIVVDIGPGPYGGIFWGVDAKENWIIEPIYSIYKKEKLWKGKENIHIIEEKLEDIDTTTYNNKFDIAIACNSIDHGYDIFKGIENLSKILRKNSKCYLLVHCRKMYQLNVAHRQSYTPEELEIFLSKFFNIKDLKISDKDPLEGKKYVTIYGTLYT